jgi:glucose/arabinose dehydrogenase
MRRALAACALLILGLHLAGCGAPPANPSESRPQIALELVARGFAAPVVLAAAPDGSGRLFVADQTGRIWILDADGQRQEMPFLDVRRRMVDLTPTYDERGLLGFAFHPRFRDNGRFFVYYSAPLREGAPEGWDHTSRLSEIRVSPMDPALADPSTERVILQVDQPQSNHNGGHIAFGPDGYLYVALGDGGGANDTGLGHPAQGNGQDTGTLLGSILRLDVDAGEPYGIPPDNPLVGTDGRDEIYAYGLRNPFRMAFDTGGDHALFVGDVGQNLREEVNIVSAGGNYGWRVREGSHCFDPSAPDTSPAQCPDQGADGVPLRAPILEYSHETGIAVIGGIVYRGNDLTHLEGHYIFGDWSTSFTNADGKIFDAVSPTSDEATWSFRQFSIATTRERELTSFLLSFGEDSQGELYALTSELPGPLGSTGRVYKLVPPE